MTTGVLFIQKEFLHIAEVTALEENLIVNCTGLGARDIWQDSLVKPVKGQLVILPPQPRLQYLYSGLGYLFPRQDGVVVGGRKKRISAMTNLTFKYAKQFLQGSGAYLRAALMP